MATRRRIRTLPIPILLLALAAGCEPGAPAGNGSTPAGNGSPPSSDAGIDGVPDASSRTPTPSTSRSTSRVALPGLFSIMVGLQADMARVSRGLWIEDYDSIAAGAEAVADHPVIPQEERRRISEILGPDMSRFGEMDQEVHDLAVRLAEAAGRGEPDAVLSLDAELRRGCVACHSTFRERLRASVVDGGAPR